MTWQTRRPVLVGVDGRAGGMHALGFGAAEAVIRRAPLRVVCVHGRTRDPAGGVPTSRDVQTVVADALAKVLNRYPALTACGHVLDGRAEHVLVAESAEAELTVVGSRGRGALTAMVAGSVSAEVAAHGHGPVVVVRGAGYWASRRPILVGLDGTPAGDAAVGFAFEEAALRRVPLHAICVWAHSPITDLGPVAPPGYHLDEVADDWRERVLLALAIWRDKYPGVALDTALVHSLHPAEKVLAAADGADLVVVGSHPQGELRGLLRGSVAHTLVHRSPCPVAVVS